jgi:CarboxypepD_reg-like domain
MRLWLLIFMICFSPAILIGQIYSGVIKDSISQKPVAGALIVTIPSYKSTQTDSLGRFTLQLSANDTLLRISHLNYNRIDLLRKSISSVILLSQKRAVLNEVTITSRAIVVYESKTFQVLDYAFSGKFYLMLVYKDSPDQSSLLLLDSTYTGLKSVPVPYPAKRLYKDAFGSIHIICAEQTLQADVVRNTNGINILFQKSTLEAFERTLLPLTAQNKTHFFYEYYSPSRLSVTYSAYSINKRTQTNLLTITDTIRQQMLDDEANRRKNHEQIMQSGMGSQAIAYLLQSDPFFTANILYKKSVTANLHTIHDSIYIFDLCTGEAYVYSEIGNYVRQFRLSYNPKAVTPEQVIVDEITGIAYLCINNGKNTCLQKINLIDGSLEEEVKLDFAYPKNIQVNDGWIWYLYRERETFQHTSLYRQPV